MPIFPTATVLVKVEYHWFGEAYN